MSMRDSVWMLPCLIWILVWSGAQAMDIEDGDARITQPKTPVIDLDTNATFFPVECTLNNLSSDINKLEIIQIQKGKLKKIDTMRTNNSIMGKIDVTREKDICGKHMYYCYYNDTRATLPKTVYIGRKVSMDPEMDLICRSENRKFLTCHFSGMDYCDFRTYYYLFMNRTGSECYIEKKLNTNLWRFNSSTNGCEYQSAHKEIALQLVSENFFGNRSMVLVINNYDLLQPSVVENLRILELHTRNVSFSWNLPISPIDEKRIFEFQFNLTSSLGYGNNHSLSSFVNMSFEMGEQLTHRIVNLQPYTKYTLSIRSRLALSQPRKFEQLYWSRWVSTDFATEACVPDKAPFVVPGTYTLRKRINSRITVDVYWKGIPEHLWNGPDFGYDVVAIATNGERIQGKVSTSEMATFSNLEIGSYRVEVTSFNKLGRAKVAGSTVISFESEIQSPIIKRVSKYANHHEITWYPPKDQLLITEYSLIYCKLDLTGACANPLEYVEGLPPSSVGINVSSSKSTLNFALAVKYHDYASSLTWMECIVEENVGIGNPEFDLGNVTSSSAVLYINVGCKQRSWIEYYVIDYWPEDNPHEMLNLTVMPYENSIFLDKLRSSRSYSVRLTAVDEAGNSVTSFRLFSTLSEVNTFMILVYTVLSSSIIILVVLTVKDTVQRKFNIRIEIPDGLLDMYKAQEMDTANKQTFIFGNSIHASQIDQRSVNQLIDELDPESDQKGEAAALNKDDPDIEQAQRTSFSIDNQRDNLLTTVMNTEIKQNKSTAVSESTNHDSIDEFKPKTSMEVKQTIEPNEGIHSPYPQSIFVPNPSGYCQVVGNTICYPYEINKETNDSVPQRFSSELSNSENCAEVPQETHYNQAFEPEECHSFGFQKPVMKREEVVTPYLPFEGAVNYSLSNDKPMAEESLNLHTNDKELSESSNSYSGTSLTTIESLTNPKQVQENEINTPKEVDKPDAQTAFNKQSISHQTAVQLNPLDPPEKQHNQEAIGSLALESSRSAAYIPVSQVLSNSASQKNREAVSGPSVITGISSTGYVTIR